jgi:hypothetical protein
MLNTLKKIAAKIFPRKLAKEVTAEIPTTVLETVPVAELPVEPLVEAPVQLLIEPAPEVVQAVEQVKKLRKAPAKKKKKA